MTDAPPLRSLRDRKRERTRRALVEAAAELFEQRGYDGTTVADIAAAAEIGARTFFSYFSSKEEVLFPDSDARTQAVLTEIEARRDGDRPVDVLLRALRTASESDAGDDMVGRLANLRMQLIETVPAVRGRALQIQLTAQEEIAGRLRAAFPDQLDDVAAAALVGAFVGAIAGALRVLLADPQVRAGGPEQLQLQLQLQVRRATELALRPWS